MADSQTRPEQAGDWKWKAFLFLSGQTVSLFGSSLVQYAIVWYITLTSGSGIVMTISTLCSFLPQICISLFAGVWADRFNRKYLIMLADGAIAVTTLVLIVLFSMGYQQLWLLFVVSAIRSVGAGIQTPAVNALIPQIVPEQHLMRVNGINGGLQSLILILSPAVAGGILSIPNVSLVPVLMIDVVTAAVGIGLMFVLKVPRLERQGELSSPMRDLQNGVRYVFNHRFLRILLIVYAILMFLITPAAMLTPLMIKRTFGDDYWRLTLNEVLFSFGSVLGSVLIAAWGGFKNRIHTIALAGIGFGLTTALMGILPGFAVYLVLIGLSGITMPFFNSPSMVLLQEKVSPEMQGRVFSFVQIVASAAVPLGMVVFGPLADWLGKVQYLLIITGVLILCLSVAMLTRKDLVKEGLPPEKPEEATGSCDAP